MQASTASNEVRLPRAVVRQLQALQPQTTEPEPSPADATPPVQPGATPANPAGTQPQAPNPPIPPATPEDPRHGDLNYWRQRFQATDGHLKRERTERVDSERALRQQITELQQEVARLQSSTPGTPVDPKQLLSEDQIAALGEDEAQAVAAAALKAAQQAVDNALKTHVQPLHAQREGDQQAEHRRRQADFVDALTAQEPGWQEIDKLPDWHQWLAEPDASTGMTRQEILDKHIGRYNATGVAAMVRSFATSRAPAPQPPVLPHGSGATPTGDLPPADPTALRPPTAQETKDFFKRSALGKVSAEERATFDKRLRLRHG